MLRLCALAFAALLPLCASAQTLSTAMPNAPSAHQDKPPVGAVSFGYIYLAPQSAPGSAFNWHFHGFYGIAQYNLKPWLALFADFTQDYNLGRSGPRENVQSKLGGFLFTAKAKSSISPLAFADAGYVRDSRSGSVTESPAFAVGGGATFRINRYLRFLVIPGEYVRTYAASGDLNTFTARAGFVLPLYR